MPLQGSLKEFSLADIFQLVGLQKKTGILILRDELDEITILFEKGMIVGANSRLKKIEDRIGQLLVRSGKVSQDLLNRALEIQKETLQQLGYVLIENDMITLPELKDALQKQILLIIYRLFRWKKGDYEFHTKTSVDYNRDFIEPTPAEKILMEGIRMLDEWPLIELVIPNYDIVFKKVPLEKDSVEKASERYLVDDDNVIEGLEVSDTDNRVKNLDPRQSKIYDIIDGTKDINAIIEVSPFNEFETCRTIVELEKAYLIEKSDIIIVREPEDSTITTRKVQPLSISFKALLPILTYIIITIVISIFFINSELHGIPKSLHRKTIQELREIDSEIRSKNVREALRIYHLMNNSYPDVLEELYSKGFISHDMLYRSSDPVFYYEKESFFYNLDIRPD